MAVKVSFEIGHTAKLKSKKTPEGFTHDWELYVRGVDKIDMSHFVDKVVFNLHDSFPKPKRTYKEAPYVLKESGYAGFVLPIDIYFKNRDDPKRVTYSYDLDLQNTGPPVHRSVVKKFIFNNPSEEFKQKLLKGGGTLLMMNYDEKSRDSTDERSQVSKSKSSIDPAKKHKIRPEDSKLQTFATLFGTPITKTSTKVSPDPKSKGSPGLTANNKNTIKSAEKSASVISGLGKEKSEKGEKKEKHRRSSPHREREVVKDDRKIVGDEKRDRKEEKTKEKSHSKDRDRSKDRGLKRPASPKRLPSPKRPSPPRSTSSTASRGEENPVKQPVKNELEGRKLSSNSGKKSKKEKKSHEKDKDRERKERDRDRKDKDERSNSSNSHLSMASSNVTHSGSAPPVKSSADTKVDVAKKDSGLVKDTKEVKKIEAKVSENSNPEKKPPEKHDKDSEKKHKHKKKDKSKEKDKEKDASSKDKRKEKINKQRDEIKKISQPSPQMSDLLLAAQQKSTPNSVSTASNKLSDQDTSDSENESSAPPPSEPKSNNNHSDASNGSFPDLMVQKPVVPQFEESKPDKKEHKSRDKPKSEKDSKKRKRKSKDDPESFARKSVSPVVNCQTEPPGKLLKKDVEDKVSSPITSTSNQATPQDSSPRISISNSNSSPVFRTPSSAPVPVSISANNSSERNSINVDYMSELRELQHKIMTLQDNNELQQVVEMIAATGRFEVTSKTFDFDLCALDRTTVQRLQDFLATTVS